MRDSLQSVSRWLMGCHAGMNFVVSLDAIVKGDYELAAGAGKCTLGILAVWLVMEVIDWGLQRLKLKIVSATTTTSSPATGPR